VAIIGFNQKYEVQNQNKQQIMKGVFVLFFQFVSFSTHIFFFSFAVRAATRSLQCFFADKNLTYSSACTLLISLFKVNHLY